MRMDATNDKELDMTAQEQAESNEVAPESTETPEAKESGGGLRKELERSQAENKKLRADARVSAFATAGIDTTNGLGKAIAQVYEGEASAEAIQAFAIEEYGWQPSAAVAVNPAANAIHAGNERMEAVGQHAGSIAPPSNQDALAKAEAEGDYQTAMAIKSQQLMDMFP